MLAHRDSSFISLIEPETPQGTLRHRAIPPNACQRGTQTCQVKIIELKHKTIKLKNNHNVIRSSRSLNVHPHYYWSLPSHFGLNVNSHYNWSLHSYFCRVRMRGRTWMLHKQLMCLFACVCLPFFLLVANSTAKFINQSSNRDWRTPHGYIITTKKWYAPLPLAGAYRRQSTSSTSCGKKTNKRLVALSVLSPTLTGEISCTNVRRTTLHVRKRNNKYRLRTHKWGMTTLQTQIDPCVSPSTARIH